MAARQDQKEARVVGDRLVAAGFRRVPADTPAKQEHLARMPKLLFTSTATNFVTAASLVTPPVSMVMPSKRCGTDLRLVPKTR